MPQHHFIWFSASVADSCKAGYALKGGPGKLLELMRKALLVSVPPFLVGNLMKSLESNSTIIPSATTLRRNEFCIDLALLQYRRMSFVLDMRRYLMCDSSPVGDHDWLWAIVHEIANAVLVDTVKACHAMAALVESYLDDLKRQERKFDWREHVLSVPPHWQELCKTLLNVHEYVYAPGPVTSGHRSNAHKAGVLAHFFHLDVPVDVQLSDYTDTFETNTIDMGIELGTGALDLEQAGSVLAWRRVGGLASRTF